MQKLLQNDPIFIRNKPDCPGRSSCSVKAVYGFEWNDELHKQVRVKTGEKDIDKEIQAAAGHDIFSEIRKLRGEDPIEQLNNAVDLGLVTEVQDFPVGDTTEIPDDIHEAEAVIDEGHAAYEGLDPDLKENAIDDKDFIAHMTKAKLNAYVDRKVNEAVAAYQKGDK